MKTVIINRAFDVDAPKRTTHQPGDEMSVADTLADQWIAKGLARAKVAPKPAAEKPAPKSAD